MRLSRKLGASVATTALGAAVVLGASGVAHAQSSLGPSASGPVALTVSGSDSVVSGTLTNNATSVVTCTVHVSEASVVTGIEAFLTADATRTWSDATVDPVLEARLALAAALGQNTNTSVTAFVGETRSWSRPLTATSDFRAGAVADCGNAGFAYAYESGGLFGSLDLGSLGS
ncbi:hypothetical protein [Dietzia natronolimnaea]|uniref:hypothetical protein n=1 Tax=Dietzia natronolimnaea TaxID=161920 RepID=UPI0015FAFC0C|nr:hypothetical protein [Dietzia natronolimnaea]